MTGEGISFIANSFCIPPGSLGKEVLRARPRYNRKTLVAEKVSYVPLNYGIRFSGPMTVLTARSARHGDGAILIYQPDLRNQKFVRGDYDFVWSPRIMDKSQHSTGGGWSNMVAKCPC
jgi:hypothetical protein